MSDPSTEPPKVALVTGATRNIGRAVAERLQDDGYTIVATASPRDEDPEILGPERGWDVQALDLADAAACRALLSYVEDRHGRIDCLVNNAATWVYAGLHTSDEEWRQVLEVNVVAPARLVRDALPLLRRAGGARIVNIGSISAWFSERDQVAYSASKAALHALTRAFAVELAPEGMTVNAVAPGLMDTTTNQVEPGDPRPRLVPSGGFGSPREVANLVSFLASAEACYINGAVVTCDGGVTATGIFAQSWTS
jgi:3-oxoacyl-[acyl-carrier protein] reductase